MDATRKNKMQKTIIGYVPTESPIYKFHPLTRLVLFVITGFIPIFIDSPEINIFFILLLFGLFIYARVNLSNLKVYAPMMITIGFFIFLTYWLAPGNDPSNIPMGKLLGKPLYYQPIRWAIVSYVRILALLFAAIFYFTTNREKDILAGLRAARVPFVASYFMGLSLRSAGMFIEDLHTIREAEQARGLDSSAMGFRDKVKHYSMYMIPLFTLALRRGDEVSNALFCKGYSFTGMGKRVDFALSRFSMRLIDKILVALMVLALIGVAYVSLRYHLFKVEHSLINLLFARFIS